MYVWKCHTASDPLPPKHWMSLMNDPDFMTVKTKENFFYWKICDKSGGDRKNHFLAWRNLRTTPYVQHLVGDGV